MGLEALSHRCELEVNILHQVGLPHAVLANHSLVLELVLDAADGVLDLPVGRPVLDLLDALQTSFVGDELVDVVQHQGQAACVVESASSEPRACLETRAFHLNGLRYVEEAGLLADLTEGCLSEGLLDDDVEKSVHDRVVLHFRCC